MSNNLPTNTGYTIVYTVLHDVTDIYGSGDGGVMVRGVMVRGVMVRGRAEG